MITILISVALGLLVNECCDVSPWCADKLVRWSACRRYTDPARAAERAEELAAVIETRPGKLLKLFTALGFACSVILTVCQRELDRRRSPQQRQVGADARAGLPSWVSLFPGGRRIYYEGSDPDGFLAEIQAEFGFNPGRDPGWAVLHNDDDEDEGPWFSYSFQCPAEHLDAIYGNNRFPMGS